MTFSTRPIQNTSVLLLAPMCAGRLVVLFGAQCQLVGELDALAACLLGLEACQARQQGASRGNCGSWAKEDS